MVWLWTTDGEPYGSFRAGSGFPDPILELACDPLGEMIAIGMRWEVVLLNWDGSPVGRLAVDGVKVFRIAFSPDGARILTMSDSPDGPSAELWARTGRGPAFLADTLDTYDTATLVFDDHGRYIFGRRKVDWGVAIVDMDGGYLGTLAAAQGTTLVDTARSPGGELIAAAFSDGLARIWSIKTRRRAMTLRIGDAQAIEFTADGKTLLVASTSGPIQRIAMDVEDLFTPATRRVDRVLTPEELERFGIETPHLGIQALRTSR